MLISLLLLATDAPDLPADDGFDPAGLFVALVLLAVCLVLVGIGLALGGTMAGCVALLVAFGVVSSSALVLLWSKRWSAGLRIMHYQVCAAAGVPGGIALLWLACRLFVLPLSTREILLFGAGAGVVGGLLFAGALDLIAKFAMRRVNRLAQAGSAQL